MSYMMTKLLPLFLYPLGFSIVVLLLARWLAGRDKSWMASLLVGFVVVLLWVGSMPRFSDWLVSTLEHEWPPVSAGDAPPADAIVLLGGMIRGVVPGMNLPDLSGSVDRIFHAAALYREGKAPVLLLAGGNATGYRSEAESMRRMIQMLGVPDDVLLLENQSRNTRQNARYSADLLNARGVHDILLVTSAYHMRRAKREFERQGFRVFPAATDYQVVNRPVTLLDWMPEAGALQQTTRAIKEYLGLLVQAIR
ncbi:YdcF family protein [Thiolapillus sp.]